MELQPNFSQPSLPITNDSDNSSKDKTFLIKTDDEVLKDIYDKAINPEPNVEIRLKNLKDLRYGLLDLLKTKINDSTLISQERKDHLIKGLDENPLLKSSFDDHSP